MTRIEPHQKKTPAQMKQWLFDSLMETIEPELMIANREGTVALLKSLSKDDVYKKMDSYKESFCTFIDRWPDHVKQVLRDLEDFEGECKTMVQNAESDTMAKLEEEFSFDEE